MGETLPPNGNLPMNKMLKSYEYNIKGSYNIEEVTGTFYKLTNTAPLEERIGNISDVIYVPKTDAGLNVFTGGSKQKKTRKNRRNSKKLIRRR